MIRARRFAEQWVRAFSSAEGVERERLIQLETLDVEIIRAQLELEARLAPRPKS